MNEEKLNAEKKESDIISKNDLQKSKEEQEEKIKQLYIKKLSSKEVISKSINISLKNWRKSVFDQIKFLVVQYFLLYIPILKAQLIDSISTSSSYTEVFICFKKYILFLVLQFIVKGILEIFDYFFIRNYTNKYKNILLEKVINKDLAFFDIFKTGEIIGKLNECEKYIECDFIFRTLSLFQNIIKLILMGYYLYKTSYKLTMIFTTIFLCQLGVDFLFENFSGFVDYELSIKMKNSYTNKLNELISNIRMVKSFGTEKEETKKLEEFKLLSHIDLGTSTVLILNLLKLVKNGGEAVTLLFAGKYILEKQYTLGSFTVFKQYQSEFSDCYDRIRDILLTYRSILSSWKSFFELYDFPEKIKSLQNYIPKKLIGKIQFENVTFSYPLKPNTNILQNLSFDVKPGKILAICGFSGSGKTSILNLIQRFYDPLKGNIYIDDVDIRNYNLEYLRKNIGIVAQEPILNSGTIEENITYGVDSVKKSQFDEVLKLSNIDSFVNDKNLFPEGLKTLVGERGANISGGQKQRIAIARALMKNSKILIFDEATSALDAESEAEVQRAIDNIIKEKGITIIIIAHRLSTIINADAIAVLNKGCVVEMGKHEELMNKNGEYKKLFQKQLIFNKNNDNT